jgi:hypothetical protein
MATVDATALLKLAQVFEVAIEDLIEVVESSSSLPPTPLPYAPPRSRPRAAESPGEWEESIAPSIEEDNLPS